MTNKNTSIDIEGAVKKYFCGTGKKDDMACFTPDLLEKLFRNEFTSLLEDIVRECEGVEIERAHTYASENADVYRAHDAGQEQMKHRLLSLIRKRIDGV